MAETSTEQQAPPLPPKSEKTKPSTNTRPRRQAPYAVILHNDPINNFNYVMGVLQKVFHYGVGKCFWLTMKAHVGGRSLVWTGTLEVAELKVQQIHDCGPDPTKPRASPIKATAEPLPD